MNPEEKKNHRGGSRLQKPEKPQREKKPRPQRTRQQKALRILYIVLTVIAALIVAGFVIFNFISAPPDVAEPTPTPRTTTYIDDEGNEVDVKVNPGASYIAVVADEQIENCRIDGQPLEDVFGG